MKFAVGIPIVCWTVAMATLALAADWDKLGRQCEDSDAKSCQQIEKAAQSNKNAETRLDATLTLNNQELLARIARADKDPFVRAAAASQVADRLILAEIEGSDKEEYVQTTARRALNRAKPAGGAEVVFRRQLDATLHRSRFLVANQQVLAGVDRMRRAVQVCDAAAESYDPCAEAWDWYGIFLFSDIATRSKVEPLFRKAMEAIELRPHTDESLALALELEALVLIRLGEEGRAKEFQTRGVQLRGRSVLSMSPAIPGAPATVRVGNGVSEPQLVSKTEPSYTEVARRLRIQAKGVLLSLIVETNGEPSTIRLIRAAGFGLDERAALALKTWRFHPGMMNGKPVRVAATVEVNFRLL